MGAVIFILEAVIAGAFVWGLSYGDEVTKLLDEEHERCQSG